MRILSVTLCTLAICAANCYAAFAQVLTNPDVRIPVTAVDQATASEATPSVASTATRHISVHCLRQQQNGDITEILSSSLFEKEKPLGNTDNQSECVEAESLRPNNHEADIVANIEVSGPATEDFVRSPLERSPSQLLILETANHLSAGALALSYGARQPLPDSNTPGTGFQLYSGSLEWGITDNLQFDLAGQVYDDPPTAPINGQSPNITLISLAPSLKYRLLRADQLSLSVQGSVELLSFASPLFDISSGEGLNIASSLSFPLTYTASPEFQFHLTPGVFFLPSTLNNRDFYGTNINLGTGISWQPSQRWLLYGSLNLPLGPGGNTINTGQGIERQLVWATGTRYNVTPRAGINLYATNSFGATPATNILTSIPSENDLVLGLALNYSPDNGLGYQSSFNESPSAPLSNRDRQLVLDGITLTTANTLEPGNIALTAGVGTQGSYELAMAYSPDQNLQFEAIVEGFGSDGSVSATSTTGNSLRYSVGAKLQLLDQKQGAPFSLSARVLGGRNTDPSATIGVLFADLPITYQVNRQTALFLNPRVAAFGEMTNTGLGLGINYELDRGVQLLGEVTPMFDGNRAVWALGTRYSVPATALSVDLYATNAIGRHGLGTLVGQAGTRFGIGFNWILGQ